MDGSLKRAMSWNFIRAGKSAVCGTCRYKEEETDFAEQGTGGVQSFRCEKGTSAPRMRAGDAGDVGSESRLFAVKLHLLPGRNGFWKPEQTASVLRNNGSALSRGAFGSGYPSPGISLCSASAGGGCGVCPGDRFVVRYYSATSLRRSAAEKSCMGSKETETFPTGCWKN